MDITIVGRHTKVSEDFRDRILEKLDRVRSLAPRATRLDVHVVHERNPKIAQERERIELTLHGHGPVIRAEASAGDRVEALDLAGLKLVERLRKQHERRAHRHQGKASMGEAAAALPGEPLALVADAEPDEGPANVEAWEGAPAGATREVPLAGTPITIRSKTHEADPMSVTDAIDQMELVGHDFFLFRDAETGMPSAVYRRRGWTYGVIHLAPAPAEPTVLGREELRETA